MDYFVKLFEIDVLDCDDYDISEESLQYNNVSFAIESLQKYNGKTVEIRSDWKCFIWSDEGEVIDEFFLIENEEFKNKLYSKYPKR